MTLVVYKHNNRIFHLLYLLFFTISASLLFARDGVIKSLNMRVEHDKLFVVCQFADLIDSGMQQSLASGMSSSLNFHIELRRINGNKLRTIDETVLLRYDIWEKKYRLRISNQEMVFKDIEHFKIFLNDSLSFNIGTLKGLSLDKKLQIILTLSPEKISVAQKKKLNYWLTSENETKTGQPSLKEESGFSINLSKLISLFISKEVNSNVHIFKSKSFTIQSLK